MRLHRDYALQEQAASGGGRIDVFRVILQLGVPLLFRPLSGLLGAFLPRPTPGILVTTQRNLSIQRFTAAHELGHYVLEHAASLDDESILKRSPYNRPTYSQVEIAADVFAAEFLIPKWLLLTHLSRQNWSHSEVAQPAIVYQLSLRLGTSYSATCRALLRHGITDNSTYSVQAAQMPKAIKKSILGQAPPENWRSDVWLLGPNDEGAIIEGRPGDIFIVRLRENVGSGYLWNFDSLVSQPFSVIRDERVMSSQTGSIGGEVERVVAAQSQREAQQEGHLQFQESRPWQASSEPLNRFSFSYALFVENGIPRAARTSLAAA